MIAAEQGQIECVKILLESKANVNHKDNGGTPALPLAARNGHEKVLKLLFEYKTEVNNSRWCGLIEAAEKGYLEVATELLNHKADINQQRPCDGRTALTQAIRYGYHSGDRSMENLILSNNPNVNLKEPDGMTPLLLYVSRIEGNYVRKVLELKADLSCKDQYGHTPLFWAHHWHSEYLVKILTEIEKEKASKLTIEKEQASKHIKDEELHLDSFGIFADKSDCVVVNEADASLKPSV